MELAKISEWSERRFGKDLAGDSGAKRKLVDGRSDGGHDALSASGVEIFVPVVADTEIENFETATDRNRCPALVAEMSVADGELAKSGDTKKGRKAEVGAENGMVWDVVVI